MVELSVATTHMKILISINHNNQYDSTSHGIHNVLAIYAGILTMFTYKNILRVETVIMTIFVMLLLGMAVALLTDWANLDRFDVVKYNNS